MVSRRDVGNRTGKPIGMQTTDRGEIVSSKNFKLLHFGFCVSGVQLHFARFPMWAGPNGCASFLLTRLETNGVVS